jgi:hypothetical protein
MILFAIDRNLETLLKPNLSNEEKLLWAGTPKQGIVFRNSDFFLIPFGLMFLTFSIFWEKDAFLVNADILFTLWGIPFILAGLYVSVGRFFVNSFKRSKTIYAITENRIIIRSGLWKPEITSLNIRSLSDMTLSEKTDGTGTITFGQEDIRYIMMQGMDWPGVKQLPCIELVPEIRKLYELILDIQNKKITD